MCWRRIWRRQHQHIPNKIEPKVDQKSLAFERASINNITFTADRLPYLKTLLANYERQRQKEREAHKHDNDLRQIFEPLARDLTDYFAQEYAKVPNSGGGYPYRENGLKIVLNHAEQISKGLEKLRSEGWDGKGPQSLPDFVTRYSDDALSQLNRIVLALEAGGDKVDLNIPANLEGDYMAWFLSSVTYAMEKGEGPAAKVY